jgi:excisionase family DNA binding protein
MYSVTSDKLIDSKTLSELLSIQQSTIEKARVMKSGIPFVRLGRAVRYRLSDVENYLDTNRVETE